MDLGVRLNLLCSRLDEVAPTLQTYLSSLGSGFSACKEGMNAFLQAFLPALDSATIAHAAAAEAHQAQASAL